MRGEPRRESSGGCRPPASSPRARRSLQGGQLERAEEAHLVLELDAEALVDPPPSLRHQREASALVAPPAFSMKFACRSEISAPPRRYPFSPHASISRPAPGPRRVLEDAAERALVRRLGRLPRASSSATVGLDLSGAGAEPERAPRRRPRPARAPNGGRRGRARPAERCAPRRGSTTTASSEHLAPVAAVGAGVHPHAAAGRAGDRRGELDPPSPASRARWRQTALVAPPPATSSSPSTRAAASSPPSLTTSASSRRLRRAGSSRARRPRPRALAGGPARAPPPAPRPSPAGRTSGPARRFRSS